VSKLTSSVVTDDQKLTAAIDEVLRIDRRDREHRRKVTRLGQELRVLDEEAWRQVYVRIAEAVRARIADLSITLTTWAFVEGQRDASRAGREGGR
jgi:urease accessory protein UreF